jgi:hypothetical protein
MARTYRPLLKKFGNNPESLFNAARNLGGEKADFGDLSVAIPAFPRIKIILIVWRGDDDLGPEIKIVFDQNITDYLSAEDIVVLCNLIALRLVKITA